MKVWIDVLTPKQANFFAPLVTRLSGRGTSVLVTTRKYREVNQLLKMRGIAALTIGRHGGGALKDKLIASAERIRHLTSLLSSKRCDKALSFSSPEAARVAYGLSIPHYCVSDSPHAEAASRLTIPLSEKLLTPKAIPVKAWTRYGIDETRIVRYDALDPVVWLKHFRPNPMVLNELGLDETRHIVVVRPEEAQASYLLGHSPEQPLSVLVVQALNREFPHGQVVLIPRYDLAASTKKLVGRSAIVPSSAIDATSLLSYSHLFLGGGGTMTAEAALLGVPSVSFYPASPTYVESYLVRQQLVARMQSVKAIVKYASRVLGNPAYSEVSRSRARRILHRMEDPITVIERNLRQA